MEANMNYKQHNADIIIIGAGISGAVLAERYASIGKKVLVIEKRNHIGGNCYDYYNEDGILVSKYGAHLFHTNYEDVWAYVQQFSEWYFYEHKVLAKVDGKLVPIPVNITTVNTLFGLNIQNEEEMRKWLDTVQLKNENPQNGKEAAEARVGEVLYEKMFKNYTKKQWDKYPEELDASVLNRIPVRDNFDDRYFSDKYQFLPKGGYTQMFEKILSHPNITVVLNTDFFDVRKDLQGCEKLFYTGPIDQYFDFKFAVKRKLEYRSINFVHETHDEEYYQENSVINYPNEEGFTRIVEYKHITGQKSPKTTIVKEYTCDGGDPYYPVPNKDNEEIYTMYKKEAEKLTNVYFVGRLANYKYFNMDQAFKNALDLFDSLQEKDQFQLPKVPTKGKNKNAEPKKNKKADKNEDSITPIENPQIDFPDQETQGGEKKLSFTKLKTTKRKLSISPSA
jgi:UDP-galactopyranose mutase